MAFNLGQSKFYVREAPWTRKRSRKLSKYHIKVLDLATPLGRPQTKTSDYFFVVSYKFVLCRRAWRRTADGATVALEKSTHFSFFQRKRGFTKRLIKSILVFRFILNQTFSCSESFHLCIKLTENRSVPNIQSWFNSTLWLPGTCFSACFAFNIIQANKVRSTRLSPLLVRDATYKSTSQRNLKHSELSIKYMRKWVYVFRQIRDSKA